MHSCCCGGHAVAVILAVACCWRHCDTFVSIVACIPAVAGNAAIAGVPDVLTFAGLPAFAGVPGVVGFHAVAFVPAVVCVPAVTGIPADAGILATASVYHGVPILAGDFTYCTYCTVRHIRTSDYQNMRYQTVIFSANRLPEFEYRIGEF
jgi:hypothetical protein